MVQRHLKVHMPGKGLDVDLLCHTCLKFLQIFPAWKELLRQVSIQDKRGAFMSSTEEAEQRQQQLSVSCKQHMAQPNDSGLYAC